MAYEKGKRQPNQGGKRPGAGRPTKAQAEAKKLAAEMARAELEKHVLPLVKRYIMRALGQKADKILMHAIERFVPAAKQEIEHGGTMIHEIITNVDAD